MANTENPTILITGATENIGSELTKRLSSQNIPFRAMVRSTKSSATLAPLDGAEVVVGDFNDAASITNVLKGVERAFLLTNSSEQAEAQQVAFVDVAKRGGVKHIVKLSQWAADKDSPVRWFSQKQATLYQSGASQLLERHYARSGISSRHATSDLAASLCESEGCRNVGERERQSE